MMQIVDWKAGVDESKVMRELSKECVVAIQRSEYFSKVKGPAYSGKRRDS